MKRFILILLTTALILSLCTAACAHFSGLKFCIDPGHGGSDPGAVGNGLQEKEVNLNVGLRTRDMLQLDAATVVMTRSTDVYITLSGRCAIANNNGAHRFASIHCNAFSDTSANGTETFCSPTGSSYSFDLRNRVNEELVSHLGTRNRGVKTANFTVLTGTNMPAILAELAFITNSADAAKLASSTYRHEAARAILHGFQRHYGQTPHDVGGPTLDAAYKAQSYEATMMAGSTAIVWVEFTNTGTETWTIGGSNPVRLGTWNPQDRSSPFYTSYNWIGPNRPTDMDQSSVAPGQVGRFTFIMTAPQTAGTYTEYWRLVKEGTAWFGPTRVYFTVNVTPAKGSITGTIRNANSSNPIPGATVSLNTGQTTQTNSSGVYTISNLNAATYTVTASAPGYASKSASSVVVAGSTTTTNINLSPTDTQAPTIPTNLTATAASSTRINLSWTASTDNIGVAGYKIFRGGSQVGTTSTNSYADLGLSPNTTYTYRVSAYDLAENNSGQSNQASVATHPTTVAVFQDGFPNLSGWTPDVVADGTIRGVALDGARNRGGFPGASTAKTLVGSAGTNGCWSYKDFPRPFAAGTYTGYFYDTGTHDNSRQGIHLRGYDGNTLAFSFYLGTYPAAPGAFNKYTAGVYALGQGGWTWYGSIHDRSVGWRKFTMEVLPYTGSNDLKFYVDDVLRVTTNRPSASSTFGISRTYLGHNYNVNMDGWFDDLGFYAVPPVAPTVQTPSAQSVSSIRWNFADNSNNEAGFDLLDASQNVKGTSGMNTSYMTESGLTANTRYTRHVSAWNGTLHSVPSATASAYTLSIPPSAGTINCVGRTTSTWYGTPDFEFSAVGGFGAGKVEFYRYAWTQNASHSWAGSEPQWDSGDLGVTANSSGSWYLHVRGHNGDNVANGTASFGPYQFDGTPPTAPVLDETPAYTASTTELTGSWSGAEDPESGIVSYHYAIGTDPGATNVVPWTETGGASVTHTGLALNIGETYYFAVKAENAVGLQGAVGMSGGTTVVETVTGIPEAKSKADGALLNINANVVSADFGDHFYIQHPDRHAALRVEAQCPGEGAQVSVAGRMDSIGGERVLDDAVVTVTGSPGAPAPLLMIGRNMGGSSLNAETPGVLGGSGLHNIGLLTTITGRVTYSEPGFCYLDDGSAITDGSGYVGIKMDTTTLTYTPEAPSYVRATGISGVEMVGVDDLIRVLRPRRDSDVTVYP